MAIAESKSESCRYFLFPDSQNSITSQPQTYIANDVSGDIRKVTRRLALCGCGTLLGYRVLGFFGVFWGKWWEFAKRIASVS